MRTTHSDTTPAAAPGEWRAAPPITAEPAAPAAAPEKNRGRIAAGVAALLIAVGGTTGYLVSHASAGSSSTAATAQQGTPGAAGGAGTAGGAGGMGFQPTQYHLDGTITALGSGTVTIRTSGGTTTTYTVTSSTHLVRDGATAGLSSFTVGDAVRASTTTQAGTTLNDMVAGTGTGAQGGTRPTVGTAAGGSVDASSGGS